MAKDSRTAIPRRIVGLAQGGACILLIASILLNFVNVLGRYTIAESISWAEEIMIFLAIGVVYLGMAGVSWQGTHIRMDVLANVLPDRLRRWLDRVWSLMLLVIAVIVALIALRVLDVLIQLDQRTVAAEIPVAIAHAAIPLGFGLIAVIVAFRTLGRRPDDHDGKDRA